MKKQKPSEVISGFLSFLEHMDCTKTVETCSQRNIDYLHDMEFAKDKNARNRVATKMQTIRLPDGRQRTVQWRQNILRSFLRIRITGRLSDP